VPPQSGGGWGVSLKSFTNSSPTPSLPEEKGLNRAPSLSQRDTHRHAEVLTRHEAVPSRPFGRLPKNRFYLGSLRLFLRASLLLGLFGFNGGIRQTAQAEPETDRKRARRLLPARTATSGGAQKTSQGSASRPFSAARRQLFPAMARTRNVLACQRQRNAIN